MRRSYKSKFTFNKQTHFIIRVEPYYHKLQYSKVPKGDPAGLLFGLVCSMFIFYVALSTFGSGGADLADISLLIWYIGLCIICTYLYQRSLSYNINILNPFNTLILLFNWCTFIIFKVVNSGKVCIKKLY